MFPEECENCGLKTDELEDMKCQHCPTHWFICRDCKRILYQLVPNKKRHLGEEI